MGKKIVEDGALYKRRVLEVVEAYMIIYPCNHCGSPVNQGYICMFCGNVNPSEEK